MENIEVNKILEKSQVIGNSIMVHSTKTVELKTAVLEILESLDGVWQGGRSLQVLYKTDPTEKLFSLLASDMASKSAIKCVLCGEFLTMQELKHSITSPVSERACKTCNEEMGGAVDDGKHGVFVNSPEPLAAKLVAMANIQPDDMVAVPGAGRGNIVKAICKVHPEIRVFCYEILPANQKFLKKIPNAAFIRADFLASSFPWEKFDKIVAFPPVKDEVYFIREMFVHLEVGGTIVTIASKIWQESKEHKYTAFVTWLESVGAKVEDISPEDLSEIGVTTPFVIITIKK